MIKIPGKKMVQYVMKYWYFKEEYDSEGILIYIPPTLHDRWIDQKGLRDKFVGWSSRNDVERIGFVSGIV